MERNLKKIIVAILISIIIIILILLINFKINNINTESEIQISQGDAGEDIDFTISQAHNVTEKIEYYTVKNCINNYLNALNRESSTYYIGNEFDEEIQKEYIYKLLSKEYVQSKNITQENVLDFVKISSENKIFIPIKMTVLEKDRIKKYVTYGIVQGLDYKYISDLYISVNLDFKNKTYSIEPLDNLYNSIDEIEIINKNKSIEKNDYNIYINQNITNQYVVNEYFLIYKRLSLSNPEIIYSLMSNDYKEKRFGNIENFKKYVKDNKDEISNLKLSQYLVNNYNNYIEYVAKDQYGNLYIFDEFNNSVNLKLDTYTIATEKFKTEYENAEDEKKVQMNIDKFIQMINRHDYKTSYKYISEGFKSNYFRTQNEFENCIKNNFFLYNKLEFKNIEKKGSNLYVCNVQISDLTEANSEVKEISIIMQLNDNMDFEMSFGIQ